MKTVSLYNASCVAARLTPIANSYGFLFAIYGSTLTEGKGRDLDILLIPKRVGYSIHGCFAAFKFELGAEQEGDLYEGLMEAQSILLRCPDGLLLDIQARHAKIRDAESLYVSMAGKL